MIISNISLSKRRKVKVIICDMYKPYIRLKERFFPNAILVVDSFHIISHLNRQLSMCLLKLKKHNQLIDNSKLAILNDRTNNAYASMQASK